jgi:non-ribosomal peptide synthetase component F
MESSRVVAWLGLPRSPSSCSDHGAAVAYLAMAALAALAAALAWPRRGSRCCGDGRARPIDRFAAEELGSDALEEQAKSLGDRVAVTMTTGERLTYRELRDDAARVAGMLAAAGASAGDRIAVMLPSGLDFLRAWARIGRLSATAVSSMAS